MTYSSLAALANDGDFRQRVSACAAEQEAQAGANLEIHPTAWADQNLWQLAAAPGFADAYQYALDTGIERPGFDPAVITDEQILAAVQAVLAE